ncbi:UrcA family protein [Novosphingobium sp. TH158]|uniref:UrcA family protein n=1 Tax=Novosphingobium sp. TH158 TaxID=2067455 RepID=UPI0013042757|nr:UrcA family protein [Novosphingobium sp. TH158]
MKFMLAPALAIAALAAPAVASANTTAAPKASIKFDDLDLDSKSGQSTLDQRIRSAAKQVCSDTARTGTRIPSSKCHKDLRENVLARIEAYQNRVGKGG